VVLGTIVHEHGRAARTRGALRASVSAAVSGMDHAIVPNIYRCELFDPTTT